MESFNERLNLALNLIKEAKRITAFTGAGISTESGIPDFRSPGGIWDRYRIVTFQEFLTSNSARKEYWAMKRDLFREIESAKPNRAHLALAELEKIGKLNCLITQNIDGLHQEGGNSSDIIIELHGTNRRANCLECGKTWPIEDIQARLEKGDLDPRCDVCNGFIKPATVSFGQAMPVEDMLRAFQCAATCDLFLMIGSSLQVEPAASIPREAHRAGAKLIFINRTETPLDFIATVVFRENASDVLDELVKLLKQSA
jgi:NAD-dependent deacetylase